MRTSVSLLLPSLAFLVPLAWAGSAHAGLGACGDIHVEASAECEVLVGAECEVACEPISFEAQCAADLYVGCEGGCQGSIEVGCSGTCEADCNTQCDVDPGRFDCSANCFAEGRSSCMGRCEDSQCFASCEATLEAECSASCDIVAPTVECSGQCTASCEGYCQAESDLQCQIDCQAGGYIDCQTRLEGGCVAACDVDGSLFCDGQYVDHDGNLQECISSLRALLDIDVTGEASGSCGGGRCEGEASGSVACSVDPEGRSVPLGALALLMLGLGGAIRRRN